MSRRSHGSRSSYEPYRREPIVERVNAETAHAWLVDARQRGATDGASGRYHPGCIMGTLLAAYDEAYHAARTRLSVA